MKHEVGAEDARDGAARADGGDLRGGLHGGVGEPRHHAAEEIEDREAPVAHRVFDVVAENPEIEHVAEQVHEAPVQKHRGDDGEPGRHRHHVGLAPELAEDRHGDHAEAEDQLGIELIAADGLDGPDDGAGGDQRQRHELKADPV